MCGIVACFAPSREVAVEAETLSRMVAAMRHRGPDAAGQWCGSGVALGHTRLAVIDLSSAANQPFSIDHGDFRIVYNGEIFNYVELREELRQLGHRFSTDSDTEVIVRAYKEWRDDCVARFNGMWAFAIYDRSANRLFCSRDRFGIKPLLYYQESGRLWIASEVKALTSALRTRLEPDYTAISMLLRTSRGGRSRRTCFEGVVRLPPACNLIATTGGTTVARYWDYPEPPTENTTLDEAAIEVRSLLSNAVRLRLRSDVPVGTSLSGGLDSSSIASLVREHHSDEHHAFTASYPDSGGDESEAARVVARNLGVDLHLVPTTVDDFLPTLRRIVRHMESPTYSPAVIPLWKIMEAARDSVTVLLDGQGADESLAGYTRDCVAHAAWECAASGHPGRAVADLVRQAQIRGTTETILYAGRTLAPRAHGLVRRLRGDEAVYAGPLAQPLDDPDEEPNVLGLTAGLDRVLRTQHRGTLVDLLHYGDAIGMAHSLELRSPFLDHRLVEYAFRLPAPYKLRHGVGKVVLREAMAGLVPTEVRENPMKLGFPVPIADWFRRWPERTWKPVLLSHSCRSRGLFRHRAIERFMGLHMSGKRDLSNQVLRWITAELWFQEFVD